MKFTDAEFVKSFMRMAFDGWEQGWHERNGGNLTYRVKPEEVESVIEKSEYIAEVCVLGMSRTFGSKDGTEEIVAVIVPKENLYSKYDDATIEKLIRDDIKLLSTQLTLYKRPTNIVIKKDPLPKTTTRKIKRKEVRELVNV